MTDKNLDLYVSIEDLVVNDDGMYVSNEGYDDYCRDGDYGGVMKISEFIKLILYFVNEGYMIDLKRYPYKIGKPSVFGGLCENYYGFHYFNGCIVNPCEEKFIKDIVDETTYKIIQDANIKIEADYALKYVKGILERFVKSQTSYDNVAKYKKILDEINDN